MFRVKSHKAFGGEGWGSQKPPQALPGEGPRSVPEMASPCSSTGLWATGSRKAPGVTADATANMSPKQSFTGQQHTRLHYEMDGQWIEGSYCSPLLDTGRQELACDSQCQDPPVTEETGPVMCDRDGQGLKHTPQKRD